MGNEKHEQEFLSELAIKLTASAHQLSEAARRLQIAELTYREHLVRLRKLDEQMRSLIELLQGTKEDEMAETGPAFCEPPPEPPREPSPSPSPSRKKLRYSDYIEFSNYAELKKFEKMDKITEKEVQDCNADMLMKKLLGEEGAK